MIETIDSDLHRVEIPLPGNPLKSINAYVVSGPEGHLLVDTGLDRDVCLEAMRGALKELSVDLDRTRVVITHFHADHFGMVTRLMADQSRIYFGEVEAEALKTWQGWEAMAAYAGLNGFPAAILKDAIAAHPGVKYNAGMPLGASALADGEVVAIGDYRWRCVWTPGHTRGHICLYEANRKILISGDHVLGDITPNIQCFLEGVDPLRAYLDSLEKIAALEVDLVLPGHRRVFTDLKGRTRELKAHHEMRLAEALDIVKRRPGTAYDTASAMHWDIRGKWENYPVSQKWFASGEALSHLRYLETEKTVVRERQDGIYRYRAAGA